MTKVEPTSAAGGVRVTYDVDRTAIAQQVVKFWPIGKLVDPFQINHEQPPHIFGRCVQAIKIYRLFAKIGADAHKVSFVTYDVDQLKLLEERADRIKALAHLWPRLYRDAQGWGIVEYEAEKSVANEPTAPIGHDKI